MIRRLLAAAVGAGVALSSVVLVAAPAQAAGRVSVANAEGAAVIDGTYSTKLTVSGSGFQSIKGGHGGVYVWFGTVNGTWQPSKGGVSGQNYRYVPDSEEADNQGFQRYVAFPGSDTASSAQGTLSENGSFRVTLTVPGPKFNAVGRNGAATSVDCTKVQCGIITIGAHGVKNANNETFTPVSVGSVKAAGNAAPATDGAAAAPSTDGDESASGAGEKAKPAKKVKPTVTVDRTSAVAGRVLAFTLEGLEPGRQVSVVFDDGKAAAGPFLITENGQAAGVLTLPIDTTAGTHELRVFGSAKEASVKFAVRAAEQSDVTAPAAAETGGNDEKAAKIFVVVAALILAAALARLGFGFWRMRRAS